MLSTSKQETFLVTTPNLSHNTLQLKSIHDDTKPHNDGDIRRNPLGWYGIHMPDLSGVPVFLAAGRRDTMIAPDNTERLAAILREAGADLDLRWKNTGHPLTYEELEEAREWLAEIAADFGT